MSKGKNNNSSLPLIIIGAVLIAALGGAWWLFNRNSNASRTGNANRASTANTAKTPAAATNVLGAQPPNLLGSPNAAVTVEEFADFQCGACASVHPRMKELTSIYGSRIKFVFRNFPLSIPAHDKAYNAAVAVEAAGFQGRFWEMQNLLFTNQQTWTNNPDYRRIWEEYAAKIGLDVERFKNDMAGLNAKERVNRDMERGRALNITSTPTIFINGQSVPFDQMKIEIMRQVIDAELQKASSSQPQSPANSAAPAQSSPAAPAAASNTDSDK